MRVALLAESFLPHMNGVTNSVLQVLQHFEQLGHETLVIAPDAGEAIPQGIVPGRAELIRSLPLPSYPDVRVAFARAATLAGILRDFDPDVMHLASPFVLGWQGVVAADALKIPSVAVYQTDIISYAQRYGVPGAAPLAAGHVSRMHRRSTLTLAPSSAAEEQLMSLGVDRVRRWARGVDAERFRPERRSEVWRQQVAPGELIIGYVGRLAAEKQVADLHVLSDLPGTRLVIVGDGPERAALEQTLPGAVFTGFLGGDELATALASFDVFVHPGESDTFGQTVQEAHASGVPVVATGRGGPLDLVHSSIDGWLYRPGDLADLRARVSDIVGDAAKRQAFSEQARAGVAPRTWAALGDQLIGHYQEAMVLRPIDDRTKYRPAERPQLAPAASAPLRSPQKMPWRRFVALGDSLTEGLCDTSRMAAGEFRGWADRLAALLAHTGGGEMEYANFAVRSRRVHHVVGEQSVLAASVRPDLVSIFVGSNDLVLVRADPLALAARIRERVRTFREQGADVLLVTPFLPPRPGAHVFERRFGRYAEALRQIARDEGAYLLDAVTIADFADLSVWANDRVHLSAKGHRVLAYRAAEVLGVPDAAALGGLDEVLHTDDEAPLVGSWFSVHALPWMWRRLRGVTAGDGRMPKHERPVRLGRPDADVKAEIG